MKYITAKELRSILAAVPDDQAVYIPDAKGDEKTIRSYSLHRFEDGKIELCFFSDNMCGMDI